MAPITVSARTILAWHGYKDPARVPEQIAREAELVAARLGGYLQPAVASRPFEVVSAADGRVVLEGGWTFTGRTVGRLLRDAARAVLFVATIGPRLEEQVSAFFEEEEYLTAVLLDAAGTVALHRVIKALRLTLVAEAVPAGASLTGRTSPGYGDWDLAEQAQLFQALGGMPLPVRLHAAGLMLPKKSLSGVIGLVRSR